jgi:hypothetical protein
VAKAYLRWIDTNVSMLLIFVCALRFLVKVVFIAVSFRGNRYLDVY